MTTVKQIEKYAQNAKIQAEAYAAEGEVKAANKSAMYSTLFDCTAAICHCLIDIAMAIENQN